MRKGADKNRIFKTTVSVALCAALLVFSATALADRLPALLSATEGLSAYSAMLALPEGGREYLTIQAQAAFNVDEEEYHISPAQQSSAQSSQAPKSAPAGSAVPSSAPQSSVPAGALGRVVSEQIKKETGNRSYANVFLSQNTKTDVDIKTELSKKPDFKMTFSKEPEVLIIHTHATESYLFEEKTSYTAADKTNNADNAKNVTALGDIVAASLKQGGISCIQDKKHYNEPSHAQSYSKAAVAIKDYLKKYPSIKVVVDLHRDSVNRGNDKLKTVATIKGKKAAQVMLVSGCNEGRVTDFPNWKSNLRFSLRIQQQMETAYPGLARPVRLVAARYNQNLTKGSILIEMGTEANSFDEAKYSAELVGAALAATLKQMK